MFRVRSILLLAVASVFLIGCPPIDRGGLSGIWRLDADYTGVTTGVQVNEQWTMTFEESGDLTITIFGIVLESSYTFSENRVGIHGTLWLLGPGLARQNFGLMNADLFLRGTHLSGDFSWIVPQDLVEVAGDSFFAGSLSGNQVFKVGADSIGFATAAKRASERKSNN